MTLDDPVACESILGSESQGVQILPMELWSHIFHHIPHRSRQPITLVCQTFWWLAQPLLFENIEIEIEEDTLDTLDDQLKFITSPRIASAVLVCRLTQNLVDPKSSNIVLNALPQFSNLRYLRLDGFGITNSLLETISGFRRPPDLYFISTPHEVDNPPALKPPIPLRYLRLGGRMASDHTLATISPILVHPTHTHTLVLSFESDPIFLNLLNTGSVFALRSLTVHHKNTHSPEFIAFLDVCPALEELRFPVEQRIAYSNFSRAFRKPSKTALPCLRVFQGPSFMVEAFTRNRPVAHLVIWGFNQKDARMIQMLASQGARYPIESLGLYVGRITNELVGVLSTMSVIRALSLVVIGPQNIYSTVKAIKIPPTLERFSGNVYNYREISGKSLLLLFPKEKYPRLRYLCDYDYKSYNPATGKIVEYDSIENWQRSRLGLYQPLFPANRQPNQYNWSRFCLI